MGDRRRAFDYRRRYFPVASSVQAQVVGGRDERYSGRWDFQVTRDTKAIDNVSFNVNEGEIFGIVGPNGAGKTTSVEAVVGLRAVDSGHISVLGMNPRLARRSTSGPGIESPLLVVK